MLETSITERAGHVCGWLGNGLAILAAVAMAYAAYSGDLKPDETFPGLIFIVAVFVLGRAARYILAGPGR